MSELRADGGYAFPVPMVFDGSVVDTVNERGMSLRDYFAAAALTGMIANTSGRKVAERVRLAWEYADAMLKERSKP